MDWAAFRSGSDIRGCGLGDTEPPLYLSDSAVEAMAGAFALWLTEQTAQRPLRVAVGHDCRLSSERIKLACLRGLTARGVQAVDCGLSSTPAMFFAALDLPCDGAIQITASHHPMDRNGLKFFTPKGGLEGTDIARLLEAAASLPPGEGGGTVTQAHYMARYAARLRDVIRARAGGGERPLEGCLIAVDAGNGVGGFFASEVLAPLGADISAGQFLEPDGRFPNHAPNPENTAAMESISRRVRETGADFGVIFDTDVDRAGCVEQSGMEINRNRLVALAAALALESCPGGTIVTDSVTSDGLTTYIESLGGRHLRYRRGYRNVIDKQLELTAQGVACPLAIETSGHAAFAENHFLDDGAYLIALLVAALVRMRREGKRLEDKIASLEEPAEERELRFTIHAEDFRSCGEQVIADLRAFAAGQPGWRLAARDYEGVRVSAGEGYGNGWFLLRLSVHDPVMPLNLESSRPGGIDRMLETLRPFLAMYPVLAEK
ncbi:MAG: phosphomannomutase/phosphoglucomutase [Oscillospiraceae bacterium]|nr:phosphomannomutase/phosphoglucomutase [Oscillospiraceae bacterium]